MATDEKHGYYWVVKIERIPGGADLYLSMIEEDGEVRCALAGVIELASRFADHAAALKAEAEVRACKALISQGEVIQKYDTKLLRMGCCTGCEEKEHAA
jgi:hypothetical protein